MTILAKLTRVYWDSCAWLGLINGEADKRRELQIIYESAKNGNYELWTSTWTLVECHREASEKQNAKPLATEGLKRIREFFQQPFIKQTPVDAPIANRAAELLRTTPGLKKKGDAVHLASALWWSVDELHTYDGNDLLHLSYKFVDRRGRSLLICKPKCATDGPLFGNADGK